MQNVTIQRPSGPKIVIPHFPVDHIMANERAGSFTKRSIKNDSKMDALYCAISMVDLTT
ncbi:MAG: hypothetical protein HN509_03125, partial [Halobacteriovoraceae bacterium]|nr:hypothetical protein [Halobacteriovoraceae bacterium]